MALQHDLVGQPAELRAQRLEQRLRARIELVRAALEERRLGAVDQAHAQTLGRDRELDLVAEALVLGCRLERVADRLGGLAPAALGAAPLADARARSGRLGLAARRRGRRRVGLERERARLAPPLERLRRGLVAAGRDG